MAKTKIKNILNTLKKSNRFVEVGIRLRNTRHVTSVHFKYVGIFLVNNNLFNDSKRGI